MSRRFGVIVEDQTDGDVIRVVIRRSVGPDATVKIRPQKGCSRIKAKAARLIADLGILRRQLSACCETGSPAIRRLICIPIEELEAWFWADPVVVNRVGRGRGDAHPQPHMIAKPKESLQTLSRGANSKPRYTTQDNGDLAELLDIELCKKRCPSFKSLIEFLAPSAPRQP